MLTRRLRDVLAALAAAVAALALAVGLLTARVQGVSMSPTVRDGDALLVDRVGIHYQAPRRGDVVVVAEPGGVALVKRVIALPGDTVEIDGTAVLVRPRGDDRWQRLEEPYTTTGWTRGEFCCDALGRDVPQAPRPVWIPTDRFFLLGDNRDASTDSRRYGLFTRDQLIGRVLLRWWPPAGIGGLPPGPTLVPVS